MLLQVAPNINFQVTSMVDEGQRAMDLMERHGFTPVKQVTKGQAPYGCPFHEGPTLPKGKQPNFYLNKTSGLYYCQAASCGAKGNLQTLERYFGVDSDPAVLGQYKSRNDELSEYQAALDPERRAVFHKKGLSDQTIDRFRLGYDETRSCYVIPYLNGNRPARFRFYDPTKLDGRPKYWWDSMGEVDVFNYADGVGDSTGLVVIAESECDAMLLWQAGFAVIAVPGAGIWKPEWAAYLTHAKNIAVVFDNDSLEDHRSAQCKICPGGCVGHNPGQDGAGRLVGLLGYRARNIELPKPDDGQKVDVCDYVSRDDHSLEDLRSLVLGTKQTYRVRSFLDITKDPPPETVHLVDGGLLVEKGRLLVSGAAKTGKSRFAETLALSLASGFPFLNRFEVARPFRVLLLDRELSERSLYDRISALIEARPAFEAGVENLLLDYTSRIFFDDQASYFVLKSLVNTNRVNVVIFDCAYKFFTGSMEGTRECQRVFSMLDQLIAETGVSVILTHHHRKAVSGSKNTVAQADPDQIVGSFLWTSWPNATVMLNFMENRVENPYDIVCSFTCFRDAPAPEPLLLKNDKDGFAYRSVTAYEATGAQLVESEVGGEHLSMGSMSRLMFDTVTAEPGARPNITASDMAHIAAGYFQCTVLEADKVITEILKGQEFALESGKLRLTQWV